MKGRFRHRAIYHILRPVFMPYFKIRFNQHSELIKPKNSPYILLANHLLNWDPFTVGMSFRQPMYYVASEHIFRWGKLSKLIQFLEAPIARQKGTADSRTVREILTRLKEGNNVCIFAEGSITYTGETGYIAPAIGKLVKLSGAGLITTSMHGGYFTRPRWGKTYRRGKLTVMPVAEYSPEQLKEMSVKEINEIIKRDLYVNAFEDQLALEEPVRFKGKQLAEGIENVLYLCPNCCRFSTITSKDDQFHCDCGMEGRFTETGFLESIGKEKFAFKTILEWNKWQEEWLKEYADALRNMPKDQPILSHPGQEMITFERAGESRSLGKGVLSLYADRFEFVSDDGEPLTIPLEDLPKGITYYGTGGATIAMTTADDISYEIKNSQDVSRSCWCYEHVLAVLQEGRSKEK